MRAAWLVLAIVLGVAAPVSARESAPTVAPAETVESTASTGPESTAPPETYRVRRCGCMGPLAFLFLLAPITLVVVVIALIVRVVRRRSRLRTPGEPVTPLTAEAMARTVIGNTLFTIAASIATIAILAISDEEVLAVLVAWFPITRTLRLAIASRFLRRLERGAAAELHDDLLVANGSYIVVSRRVVRDARMHAVPTSIVR